MPAPRSGKTPLSIKIDQELHDRLNACARATGQKKHTLSISAVFAAVQAIEAHAGRLVVPIEFVVAYVPTKSLPARALVESSKADQDQVSRGRTAKVVN